MPDDKTTDRGEEYMQGEITDPRMLGVCAKLYGMSRTAPFPERSMEWSEFLEGYNEVEIVEVKL